jgi:hypothetical protein
MNMLGSSVVWWWLMNSVFVTALLVRTFMFLGFTTLPPGHQLIPSSTDSCNLYMLYSIE